MCWRFCLEKPRPNRPVKSSDSLSMSAVPYSARTPPDCSNSTMRCPINQYAAVMAAFTERAADSLAASMIFDTSPKTARYGASWLRVERLR